MAFPQPGPSKQFSSQQTASQSNFPGQTNPAFDIIEWYPQFLSCHRYFLDHAQYSSPVQALAAFLNIRLPYQKYANPITTSATSAPQSPAGAEVHLRPTNFPSNTNTAAQAQAVSLIPYIRRLIATGHDSPGVLHGFFGDDWVKGIGALHEIERRNYLFAAKSTNWLEIKQAYDMLPDEICPFLSPLKDATEVEIQAAESTWSEWLAMQDWMLGPRAPDTMKRSLHVKRESQ